MLFMEETTYILFLLQNAASGGFIFPFLSFVWIILTIGSGIVVFYLLSMIIVNISEREFPKKEIVYFIISIISLYMFVSVSEFFYNIDREFLVKYANVRYIEHVKDNPKIKPEVKSLIESYIKQNEEEIKNHVKRN